jgi:predicted ATP-grasp superfamily ATP-dependent carboligase
LIRTAAEQATAEKAVAFRLRTELQRLNQDNAHLHPCSLILTDLLPGKSAAVSLNFYVRSDGKAQFSSFCEQNLSETGHWQGGIITYSIQQRRAVEYAEIMHKTARFLFSRGYHGPAGIDVMTDAAGRHNIVDLNPRPTGSFVLGCFRQHFTGALAMDAACVLPFMQFSGRREGFKARFGRELNRGEIIVLAWFSDLKALKCHMCLAVGGKSRDELDRLCDSIQDWVGKASHSMSDCAGVKL